MNRWVVMFAGFPLRPWVVENVLTGAAYVAPGARFFSHYDTAEQAQRVADKMNRKKPT